MISFWEKSILQKPNDLIVIGGGIVGLHTALFFKRANPAAQVCVVERSNLSYGASTRNAGFACFGSPSELLAELKEVSEDELWNVVERRWQGLLRLRQEHGDDAIGFENNGGYELFDASIAAQFAESVNALAHFNEVLFRITGKTGVYTLADDKISEFGFGRVNHLIKNYLEAQINTGAMMRLLRQKVVAAGVELYTGVEVVAVEKDMANSRLRITTHGWHGNFSLEMYANKVAVCTNAFASKLIGEHDIHPARAQVLISSPIPNLNWKGTFHYDEGYYYFRNVGQRILLGGARNKAFEQENTDEIIITEEIQNHLDEFINHVIRPHNDFCIEMRWSGIMAMGKEHLLPMIKHLGDNIYVAARCNGMGVAIGIQTAGDLNDLLNS